ncbi:MULTISPECIES: hypothetical protein [unclassified Paenibacillus]|uniref:hypothetical protein n=1 Tax=unclassified Paenibacillus TaxID=185978 RepID=UPI003629D4D6
MRSSSFSKRYSYYGLRVLSVVCLVWLAFPDLAAMAAASAPPSPGMIRVENRLAGTQDVVTVTGLSAGDIVKVYADAGASSPLGSATVSSGSTGASVTIGQLGTAAGHVYVTVTQPPFSESRRTIKLYSAEPLSVAPSAASIRVINHASGTSDQVVVRGLHAGDVVKVYRDAQKNQLLGSAAAAVGTSDETTVSVGQLGANEGIIYVTVTVPGQGESRVVEKAHPAEQQTAKPALGDIRIMNEYGGTGDRVEVNRINGGDVVKVYATERAATPIAQAAVPSGTDRVNVILPQLGTGEGTLYISLTRSPMLESARVSKKYLNEPVTPAPAPGMIVVTNENENTDDRVEVYGLSPGDRVKVYRDATTATVLGTSAPVSNSTRAAVAIPQLGKQGGNVYITVTSSSRGESIRVVKTFAAENASKAPERADIKIQNAVGSDDVVTINGLQSGDRVKLYSEEASLVPISSALVADGATSVTIRTTLPLTGYGVLYVTVTHLNDEESVRVSKIYPAEPVSLPVSPYQIRVINNMLGSGDDEVSILGLREGDRIRLYSDAAATMPIQTEEGGNAEAAVGNGESSVTINRLKLESKGGVMYVTLTSNEKRESSRTMKVYEAE